MFANIIVNSSEFIDKIPRLSRELYFYLGMDADNSGFVDYHLVIRKIGGHINDLKPLQENGYITVYTPYTLRIRHFYQNNNLQNDRSKPSELLKTYPLEKEEEYQQFIPDYKEEENLNCIHSVYGSQEKSAEPLYSIEENSVVECSIEKEKEQKKKIEKEKKEKEMIEVINHLSIETGRQFKLGNDTSKKIQTLFNKKYSIEQIKQVISFKCYEWKGNPELEQYLRPDTLFGSKNFEKYFEQLENDKLLQEQRKKEWDAVPEFKKES